MAAIGGFSLGVITGLTLRDQESGEEKKISDIISGSSGGNGAQGPKGDKGDTGPQGTKGEKGDTGEKGVGITNVSSNKEENGTTTITFFMTDGTFHSISV